jgi:hypothetical protein
MNARAIALVARSPDRWALAGDQLFIDLDLSADNLPPGARVALGSAVSEVTDDLTDRAPVLQSHDRLPPTRPVQA